MRKLILILFIILSCVSLANSGGVISFPGGGVPSAATTYPDIIFWMNGEGAWTTDPTDLYTLGASECTALAGAAAACAITGLFTEVTADGEIIGDSSFKALNAYDRCLFAETTLPAAAGRIGIDTNFLSAGVNNTHIWTFYQNNPDSNFSLRHSGTPADDITVIWREGGADIKAIATAVNTFDDTTHYVEVAWDTDNGAGSDCLALYVDGLVVGSVDCTLTLDGTITYDAFYVGNVLTGTGTTLMDNLIISNDYTREIYNSGLHDDLAKPAGACP